MEKFPILTTFDFEDLTRLDIQTLITIKAIQNASLLNYKNWTGTPKRFILND